MSGCCGAVSLNSSSQAFMQSGQMSNGTNMNSSSTQHQMNSPSKSMLDFPRSSKVSMNSEKARRQLPFGNQFVRSVLDLD